MKVALITGITDGIGKATAFALANAGWEVHGTGRCEIKADSVLTTLKKLNPAGEHEIHCFDLSDVKSCKNFLAQYKQHHEQLNFLFLNANPLPKKGKLNSQGYDPLFFVGFVSRYLFSVQLDELLQKTDGSRVIHNAQVRGKKGVDFSKLKGKSKSGFMVMYYSYAASGYMAKYFNQTHMTSVPHLIMDPGTVDTKQVQSMGWMLRTLAKLYDLITPEAMGEIINEHLQQVPAEEAAGKLFYRKNVKRLDRKLNDLEGFNNLMKLGEKLSDVKWR